MTKRAGPRYAIIPADAVTDESLSGSDLRVLALLGRHIDRKGWCVRSQGRMAKELHVARGTLQRSLGRLVDAGYVEVSHAHRKDGGQAANLYRVVLDEQARADQLDLFFGTDAVQSPGADRDEEIAKDRAPPASPVGHPLPRLDEAPPASPGRGTHKNVPLQTSPSDSRAEPRGEREAVEVETVGVAATDELAARLRDAAGDAINAAHPAFLNLSEPFAWLAAGCDLELDIVPVLRGFAGRNTGPPCRTWRYFAGAVAEARDRRLSFASRLPANVVQLRDAHVRPDPQLPAGRFAAAAAHRRSQFAGGAHRDEDDSG